MHRSFGIFLAANFFVSACAYEKLAQNHELEIQSGLLGEGSHVDAYLLRPVIDSARFALRLGERYKTLGDQAATNRDYSSATLIGLVAYGALGAASSVGSEQLARSVVAGIAVNEGAKYVNPNSAARAFYQAASEITCAGTTIAKSLGKLGDHNIVNIGMSAVAISFIRKVELRLRGGLRREIPDIEALKKAFSQTANGGVVFELGGAQPDIVLQLEQDLESCLNDDESNEDET